VNAEANKIASIANDAAYGLKDPKAYRPPHIKHAELRQLYGELVQRVFTEAAKYTSTPRVLDLGAGEGSVTFPFLELGAKVVAVDLSSRQLEELRGKCGRYSDMLETRCEDVSETLANAAHETYDIIAANSFLHHVPDYLSLIRDAIAMLSPHGQFFSFQDPLRYDSVSRFTRAFTDMAYASWRLSLGSRGDFIGGIRRRLRRRKGIYLADCFQDNAEYHITRNGVDQDGIRELLERSGFDCEIVTYFSTQSRIFQPIGSRLGVKNMFAVIAKNRDVHRAPHQAGGVMARGNDNPEQG
jgi:SAM-dependent methyltransferase